MHLIKKRLERALRAFLVVCALMAAPTARADLLVTASGESLSGDLTRVADGVLVFRTSLKGQMMLPMSEVKSLSTGKSWVVTEAGGAVHVGRFVPDGIEEAVGEDGTTKVTAVSLASVASAKPVPGQAVAGQPEEERWSAEGGVGVRAFEGTRDGVEPSVRLGGRGRGERLNTSLQLRFDVNGEEAFPTYFSGTFDVTESTEESWAPFVQGLVERDTNEALRVRTGLTVGVRYRFAPAGSGQLEGLAGFGASYGEWSRDYLERGYLRRGSDEEVQAELNVHLGLRYSRTIWGGGNWSSGLYLLPSLTDADDFRAGAASSVVYPVTNRLQLRLEMLMHYDSQPAFSALDRVDTSVGASVELDF